MSFENVFKEEDPIDSEYTTDVSLLKKLFVDNLEKEGTPLSDEDNDDFNIALELTLEEFGGKEDFVKAYQENPVAIFEKLNKEWSAMKDISKTLDQEFEDGQFRTAIKGTLKDDPDFFDKFSTNKDEAIKEFKDHLLAKKK